MKPHIINVIVCKKDGKSYGGTLVGHINDFCFLFAFKHPELGNVTWECHRDYWDLIVKDVFSPVNMGKIVVEDRNISSTHLGGERYG